MLWPFSHFQDILCKPANECNVSMKTGLALKSYNDDQDNELVKWPAFNQTISILTK